MKILILFIVSFISLLLCSCETFVKKQTFITNYGSPSGEVVFVDASVSGNKILCPTRVVIDVTNNMPPPYYVNVNMGSRLLYGGIKGVKTVTFRIPESPFRNGREHLIVSLFRQGDPQPVATREEWIPTGGPFDGSFTVTGENVLWNGGQVPYNYYY